MTLSLILNKTFNHRSSYGNLKIDFTDLTFKKHPRNETGRGLLPIKRIDKVVFKKYENKEREILNQYEFKTKRKVSASRGNTL